MFHLPKANVEKLRRKQDIKGLLKALKDRDSAIRAMAAEALGDIGHLLDDAAVSVLVQAVEDENSGVRTRATAALARTKSLEGHGALLYYLSKHTDGAVRAEAAKALRHRGDGMAVALLVEALTDEDANVRAEAGFTLGFMKDGVAVERLIATLKDEYSNVRDAAAWALGMIGDKRAVEPLIQAAEGGHPLRGASPDQVRARAIWALGEIGDLAAKGVIREALKYPDPRIREVADDAMRKLTLIELGHR